MSLEEQPGVSVVICCHNGAHRLPATLDHLAAQRTPPGLAWEVVVVDNASTDGTAEAARAAWTGEATRLRVVSEPRLGLTFARECGWREARFGIISFVDDDNWLEPDWVGVVWETLSRHPDAAVCGGVNDPAPEGEPPAWLPEFWEKFGAGPQAPYEGDITEPRGYVWGAGMSVRRRAWSELLASGWSLRLTDRQGPFLSGGGDLELCLALRWQGWRIYYTPKLRLRHFIPRGRQSWDYVKRLYAGMGHANVWLSPYLSDPASDRWYGLRYSWQGQAASALWQVVRHPVSLARLVAGSKPPDQGALWALRQWNRFREALHAGPDYNRWVRRHFRSGARPATLSDPMHPPATQTSREA